MTSSTKQSGPPLEKVANIQVKPNENGPFHFDFQLKVAEFCGKMESTLSNNVTEDTEASN